MDPTVIYYSFPSKLFAAAGITFFLQSKKVIKKDRGFIILTKILNAGLSIFAITGNLNIACRYSMCPAHSRRKAYFFSLDRKEVKGQGFIILAKILNAGSSAIQAVTIIV
ncbi:MAG: hypothetical protein JWQ25_2626 [Daejeonella sp.]|nr:hypothetical protein [Daejeonella sp.]